MGKGEYRDVIRLLGNTAQKHPKTIAAIAMINTAVAVSDSI
jgi:hypothetical protein